MSGPVSTYLEAELRELARQRGIVVWLDKEGSYTSFADAAMQRASTVPMRAFRGSYLETMLALEDLQDGVRMLPLVVHVPGHTEESITETPLFELYRAGSRHRRALATLVREAAHGLATPTAIEAFLAGPDLTLEAADAWLASQAAGPSATAAEGPDLGMHTAEALYDDLAERGPLAHQLERPEYEAAVWRRAELVLGLTAEARATLLDLDMRPPAHRAWVEIASDAATAIAGWVLCVEFVHDLRRAPKEAWLLALQHLPRPAITACQKLAVHIRLRHDKQYARVAASVEPKLPREVAEATADDLGKIDTFQFEDRKVMAAALDALHGAAFQRAHELATARTSGKSFWTTFDPNRRLAWHLIELAARLGCAVLDHANFLSDCTSLSDALERYATSGYLVDRTHRLLEQAREELPQLELAEVGTLRARLDELRTVYRGWADPVAHAFNLLCEREGFLPPPALQQRALFEDVVVPSTADGLTAYFMVDAMRFEMGQQLADQLRETKTGDVEIAARFAELPTVTEVGMNVLAPVARAGRLAVDFKDNKILGVRVGALRVDGPDDRKRVIHERVGGDTCPRYSLEELLGHDAAFLRRSLAKAKVAVIHCEGIDKAGEKGVGLVVFERELQHLRAAWRVLYEAGVKRFVFAADHGYLLHDDVTRDPLPHGKQTDPQRRHVLSTVRREQPNESCVSASALLYDSDEFHVAFPSGIAPFDRGARAKDFVHGGNSLQERVIPVVTVRHRHAAGSDKASYELEARGGLAVAGMHSLHASLRPARNSNLVFGSRSEIELALESDDDPGISVELCDVHHARRTGAGVIATVEQEFQVFFRLTGDVETRAAVRLRATTRAIDVSSAVTTERFQVVLRSRAAVAVAAAPKTETTTDWSSSLPDGVRQVFEYLATHRTITEPEATKLLGGARQFRNFSLHLDDYRARVPFAVRVEMASGIKSYVRGDQ